MKKLEVLFKFAQIRTDAIDPPQPSNEARPIISFLKQHIFNTSRLIFISNQLSHSQWLHLSEPAVPPSALSRPLRLPQSATTH